MGNRKVCVSEEDNHRVQASAISANTSTQTDSFRQKRAADQAAATATAKDFFQTSLPFSNGQHTRMTRPAKKTLEGPMKRIPMAGVMVEFPFQPYPAQIQMMYKIVQALKSKQNALLESPTGSGKSLAILCAALAWREHEKRRQNEQVQKRNEEIKKEVEAVVERKTFTTTVDLTGDADQTVAIEKQDTLASTKRVIDLTISEDEDDDFRPTKIPRVLQQQQQKIPTTKIEEDDSDEELNSLYAEMEKTNQSTRIPKIYVGSRTHRQLSQLVGELKGNTSYRPTMSVLGSREQYCIKKSVLKAMDKSEECSLLVDAGRCGFYHRTKKLIADHRLRPGGANEIWDIEDLTMIGKEVGGCPYFASRGMAQLADIIFCPYNYLLEPAVRKSMDINLENNIVILDEAHNIEDAARAAASFEVTDVEFQILIKELNGVLKHPQIIARTDLFEAHMNLLSMISGFQELVANPYGTKLSRDSYEEHISIWSGKEMMQVLDDKNMGRDMHNHVLRAAFDKVETHAEECDSKESKSRRDKAEASEDSEKEEEGAKREEDTARKRYRKCLSKKTQRILEGIFMVFGYLYKEGCKFEEDYNLALIRQVNRTKSSKLGSIWINKLAFWCLNPGVVFNEISTKAHSVILTSGTLSPLNTFASELQTEFPIRLEANHVIDKSQVWIGSIDQGPGNVRLYGTWEHTSKFSYQDSVGQAICDIVETVPYGVLCFVPSYSTMDKLIDRWKQTGLYDRMAERKKIICEPPGSGSKKLFERSLEEFYSCISLAEQKQAMPQDSMNGALLFAVYRGKVSEGIDFTDNNCRAVVALGIPYPNFKEVTIELKRAYNDTRHKRGDQVMDSSEWYNTQAYRAINQALGRCIRHRKDWGAVILLESRFTQARNVSQLSKWIRPLCEAHTFYEGALGGLRSFVEFRIEQDRLSKQDGQQQQHGLDNPIACETSVVSLDSGADCG
ncbi:helicase C-terminal domain-containing protein [Dichotomocladium elegans]|nr:helicase C-terminal domain-containing protein [Dichotomocladium elegans]